MVDATLYRKAALCYEQARHWEDAARCYRAAGIPLRAAALHEQIGRYDEAAADYLAADEFEIAGWLRVHHLNQPEPAREAVQAVEDGARRALVLARCDLAEQHPFDLVVPALDLVRADLADPISVPFPHRELELWAVAVAELAGRFDQVALIFAAAVKGGRHNAVERWTDWAKRVLATPLAIPER